MSYRVQWHSLPYHPNWVLEMCPLCGLSTSSCCTWVLVAVDKSMGGTYPGQSVARTGCDHWPWTSTLHGGSAVQGQDGGAPMWLIIVHRVRRVWGLLGGAAQLSPLLCSAWGHPAWAIKQSEMAATCPGLGDSQAKPSCESRLAAASARPGAHWAHLLLVWEDLESCEAQAKTSLHMEKQLGWAYKLGGAESLGISQVGQTVSARLMESQMGHQPARSVALPAFLWEEAVPQLSPWCQNRHLLPACPWYLSSCFPVLELRGSESDEVHMFFKRNCLGFQKFLPPIQSLLVFSARSYRDLPSHHWSSRLGGLLWDWDSLLLRYPSWIFIYHMWVWGQPVPHLHPSYQSEWLWFL